MQTAELVIGNIPAEFGSKVSGVAVLNSRSGLGTGRPFSGAVSIAGGGFGTGQGSVQVGGERGRLGYFGSVTSLRTDRFLDQVTIDNLHNAGHATRGFARVDVRLDDRDAASRCTRWAAARGSSSPTSARSKPPARISARP